MKQSAAWLILAYRDPKLLHNLATSISTKDKRIFVHVDSRCNEELFRRDAETNLEFIGSRFECPWGSFGRVSATIALIRRGLDLPVTHLALLSEDSFLLYEPEKIEAALPNSQHRILMDLAPMGSRSKPISRVSRKSPFRGDPRKQNILDKLLNWLFSVAFVNIGWKRSLDGMRLFAGDSWWVISRRAAEEIISFVDTHPKITQFFESTWIADEHFFQTILGNSQNNFEFIGSPMLANWEMGQGPNPPYFLTEHDEDWIRSKRKDYFFARKVERHSDAFSTFTEKLRASGS